MATIKQKQNKEDKVEYAYKFYLNKGYTPAQSSAIVGNLLRESNLDTTILGKADDKGSRGVAQWHSGRLDKLKSMYGDNWTNLDSQLEFVDWELNNTHKSAGDALKKTKTVWEAGRVFTNDFERPKVKFDKDEKRQTHVADTYRKFSKLELSDEDKKMFASSYSKDVAPYITNDVRLFETPTIQGNFASVPDVYTEPKEENKDIAELQQKSAEKNFMEEYSARKQEVQPTQVEEEQPTQQVEPLNIMDAYNQVSQFIDQPIAQQGGRATRQDSLDLYNKGEQGKVKGAKEYPKIKQGKSKDDFNFTYKGQNLNIELPNAKQEKYNYPIGYDGLKEYEDVVKPKEKATSLQQLPTQGIINQNQGIQTPLPNIIPQGQMPKYWDVIDTNSQRFGGYDQSYKLYPDTLNTIRELPQEGWDRKVTPHFQEGGIPFMQMGGTWSAQQAKVKAEKDAKLKLLLKQEGDIVQKLIDQKGKTKEPIKAQDATKVRTNNRPELFSKVARNKTDKEIAEERKYLREEVTKSPLNTDFFNLNSHTRENWATGAKGLESQFRVSDKPNFFDDYVNPANMIGNMASNLGQSPLQAQQSDSILPYVTSVGMPLAVGAMAGLGTQNTGQFVNNLTNPLAGTGDLVNNLGNKYLPNAYKYNPFAFKPKSDALYRGIAESGFNDAIESSMIRAPKGSGFGDQVFTSMDFEIAQNYSRGNNPMGYKVIKNKDGSFNVPEINTNDKSYIAEIPKTLIDNNTQIIGNEVRFDRAIPTDNVNFYKEDWLKGYKQIETPKTTQNFKSEINWGQWNKEIPDNPQLMKEYNAIEQTSKANGNWMKNPDGSPFQGTPEQFVQQNSENFKKAFGNSKLLNPDGSPTIQYHGSAKKFDTFDESKFQLGDAGYSGSGIYTTPNKTKASSYSLSSKSIHKDGNLEPTIYELYGKGNNPISAEELIKQKKDYDLFNFHRAKDWQGDVPLERQMREYDVAIRNQTRGVERISPWNDADELVFPTNKQLKSATGNNGMFDMTNPNIYKSIVPIAGASYLATQGQEEPKKSFQQGGIIEDDMGQWKYPGEITKINAPNITMKNIPYNIFAVADTGETKIMKPNQDYYFEGAKSVIEYPQLTTKEKAFLKAMQQYKK